MKLVKMRSKGKFLLVCAPAGYGKSTAVMDYIKTVKEKFIWFSVEEEDNYVKHFWKNLILPLVEFIPELYELTEDIFLFSDEEMVRELIPILIYKISKFESNLIMVLDDFHLIQNEIIQQSVATFIKSLPDNLKLIFISREFLPFSVEKERVRGHYFEITYEDLKFSKEELSSLISYVQVEFEQTEMDEILSQNEGWITGIQIMLMEEMQGKKNIRHFLIEEILTDLDQEMIDFFLGTSIFDFFSTALCNAVFQRSDSFDLIKKLQEKNAFIFSLDDEGIWYRYHHLFLETLRNQKQIKSDDFYKVLHIRAGKWYEDNKRWSNAIDHYLAGKDIPNAVGLIEQIAPVAISTNDFSKIMTWMQQVPDEVLESNYGLCLIKTWFYQLDTQFDKNYKIAWQYIEKAEKAYDFLVTKTKDPILLESAKADILHFKVVYGMLSNDFGVFMRASAEIAKLSTEHTLFAKNGLEFNRTQPTLIFLLFESLENFCNDTFFQTIQRLKTQKIKDLSYGYVLYGEMFYEFNKLDVALPLLIEGTLSALEEKKYGAYLPGINATAKIYWSQGNLQKAIEVLLEGEKNLRQHNKVFLEKKMKIFRVWLSVMANETGLIFDWMKKEISEQPVRITIQNEFDLSVYARGLILQKDYDEAETLLLRLLEFSDRLQQIRWKIVFNNILARLYYLKKDFIKACNVLEVSLTLGLKHKYLRIFVEESVMMENLLNKYLKVKEPLEDGSLLNFILEIKDTINNEDKEMKTALNLTETELKVLQCIKDGFTNAEIAEKYAVQIDTVKKHLTNIYKKLEVKNRTQAIREADKKKIL
ncbi:MAG: hypothetical protein JXR88_04500 [Clostridia bacterium]|nr:hypothetical protein [Clostridia bacterium]